MNEKENQQPISPEGKSIEEIRKSSEVIDLFFNPHENLEKWDRRLQKINGALKEKVEKHIDQGMDILTNSTYYLGRYAEIFKEEYRIDKKKQIFPRSLGEHLMCIGYEAAQKDVMVEIGPLVVEKVSQLPFITAKQNDEGLLLYVKHALTIGVEFQNMLAKVEKEKNQPKSTDESEEKVIWDPKAWKHVLDDVNMDDFTGERPQ